MLKKTTILCSLIFCIALPVLAQNSTLPIPYSRDYTNAILWQQRSGEYRALCFQAYNYAKLSLDEAIKNPSEKPFCVIVDVDETVLSNAAFQGYEVKKGVSYDPADWKQWVARAAADTVPGALWFLNYAASKNVETFYVTNRGKADHDATLLNLQKFSFPYADKKHLLVKETTSDKEPRRQNIAGTHKIILLCGDNLSDFSNVFYREQKDTRQETDAAWHLFGTRYIVLPNPMYGDWEEAVYEKQHGLNEEQKSEKRFNAIKAY